MVMIQTHDMLHGPRKWQAMQVCKQKKSNVAIFMHTQLAKQMPFIFEQKKQIQRIRNIQAFKNSLQIYFS